MDTITAIEPQKTRGNRRSIFVNGRFLAGVDEEVVFVLGLKVGQQVSQERLSEMLRSETVHRAREAAINLLSYRPRSRQELLKRLLLKGYDEDVVEEALEALTNADLVNDERFTRDWLAGRLQSKPMGATRVAWELRQKGIAQDLVEQAVQSIDSETEYTLALGLAQRKIKQSGADSSEEDRRKLASFLRRRGFSWDVISRVINELLSAED